MSKPERVTAIISQNGNAYVEGFSDAWGSWEAYWRWRRQRIVKYVGLAERPTRFAISSIRS
jgi:hypothetical protein